jgi:multidrug efflux pump subunit AcrA (membrane-fusion protein)
VARRLDSWFDDPDAITDLIAERLESEKAKLRSGDPESQARALSERLAKLDRMKANYRHQQAEDLMSMADLKAALADLESQRRTVEGELGKALDRQNHIDRLEADAKLALDFYAACASSGLENLEPEDRHDLYRRLKLRVTVAKDG